MPMTKEEKAIYDKAYREKNRDKILQQKKEYRESPEGHKKIMISNWKYIGIILREGEDWDSIYRTYIECENCEQCNKVFKNSKE